MHITKVISKLLIFTVWTEQKDTPPPFFFNEIIRGSSSLQQSLYIVYTGMESKFSGFCSYHTHTVKDKIQTWQYPPEDGIIEIVD